MAPNRKKAPVEDDPTVEEIREGASYIYRLYAEGRISFQAACERLAAFLDSKGETEPQLSAMAAVKGWKR